MFGGKELVSMHGLNEYDFNARMQDPVIPRFTSMDPLCEMYYSWSPYVYCMNNPMKYIDPDGKMASPIYDKDRELLGTDDKGLQGNPIILDKDKFKQGMPHDDAEKMNLGIDKLNNEFAKVKFMEIQKSLYSRPDYDGYLTKSEADAWWLAQSGKPLFVDQSKIELSQITTMSFDNTDGNSFYKNFIWELNDTGKVYGTLKMTLLNVTTGTVHIGGKDYLDEYDFQMDGRAFRDIATWYGRPGKANAGKSFLIYGYGRAKVPVKSK